MKVYILNADCNHYQSLLACDRSTSLDTIQRFNGSPIGSSWLPWRVEVANFEGYENLRKGDFPLVATNVPIFSQRASDSLYPLLVNNGELLPLRCDEGSYFAYNVTTVLDALDSQKSSFVRFTSGRIMDITRHEFSPQKLTSPIFKIPQALCRDVFITSEFENAVRAHQLTGFDFKLVWESPSEGSATAL